MTVVDRELLDTAVHLLRQAGELTLGWFRSESLDIEHKGDGTPVTAADRAAERFLREELGRLFPGDGIIGEEEADVDGTTGRTWIIDPIDGTKAFTQGVPLYCNLLAMNDGDGNAIGVINMPGLGETVYAGRGLGCFCNGEPARVSGRSTLAGSYLSTCGYDHWSTEMLVAAHQAGMIMRTWGDGYGYALVATGRVDAMVDPEVALWDVAPMPVILAEAGGRFSDFAGSSDPSTGTGVATNGILHDEVLALVNRS